MARDWIECLGLEKHPEGGYYKRNYQSSNSAYFESHQGERLVATAIYYLLESNDFSAFHALKSDELWHYYDGTCSLDIHLLSDQPSSLKLGLEPGAMPQRIVSSGQYFAAELSRKLPNDFVLVGCSVSPGFDFQDFELAQADRLIERFPKSEALIRTLTRA